MSLGFLLRARYSTGSFLRKRTPRHILADIDRWWLQNASAVAAVVRRADVGTPAEPLETTIELHPAAVPVTFVVRNPERSSSRPRHRSSGRGITGSSSITSSG